MLTARIMIATSLATFLSANLLHAIEPDVSLFPEEKSSTPLRSSEVEQSVATSSGEESFFEKMKRIFTGSCCTGDSCLAGGKVAIQAVREDVRDDGKLNFSNPEDYKKAVTTAMGGGK